MVSAAWYAPMHRHIAGVSSSSPTIVAGQSAVQVCWCDDIRGPQLPVSCCAHNHAAAGSRSADCAPGLHLLAKASLLSTHGSHFGQVRLCDWRWSREAGNQSRHVPIPSSHNKRAELDPKPKRFQDPFVWAERPATYAGTWLNCISTN
jgi:hypothetical protein